MVIYLQESLLDETHLSAAAKSAIDNVLRSGAEGSHFVFGGLDLLEWLYDLEGLSDRSRGELFRLIGSWSEYAAIFQTVKKYVSVDKVSSSGTVTESEVGWSVGLEDLTTSESMRRPRLVLEDLDDSLVYAPALKRRVGEIFGGQLDIALEPVNGGGTNTARQVHQCLEMEGPTVIVIVVDSDKASPYADLGSTAKRVTDLPNLSEGWSRHVVQLEVLPVRSVENLVNSDAWSAILSRRKDESRRRSERRLKRVMQAGVGDVWKYVDWKNGTYYKALLSGDESTVDYWCAVGRACESILVRKPCVDYRNCQLSADCKCVVVAGLGTSLLKAARNGSDEEAWGAVVLRGGDHIDCRNEALERLIDRMLPMFLAQDRLRV